VDDGIKHSSQVRGNTFAVSFFFFSLSSTPLGYTGDALAA
jgi:hypothetical protein